MGSSLQAYEEKNKRRKEELLLKTKYPLKIKEVQKDILVEE